MSFASIPIRSNGQDIDSSWFNTIRTAGIALSNNQVTISASLSNNQSSAADISGNALDRTIANAYRVNYMVSRVAAGGQAVRAVGEAFLTSNTTAGVDSWILQSDDYIFLPEASAAATTDIGFILSVRTDVGTEEGFLQYVTSDFPTFPTNKFNAILTPLGLDT